MIASVSRYKIFLYLFFCVLPFLLAATLIVVIGLQSPWPHSLWSLSFHLGLWASSFFSYILHAYCSRAGVVQFPLWASYWFHYIAKQDNFFVPCYQLFTLLLRVDWQCREISSTSGIWMAWPRKTKNRNTKVAKGQAMSWFQPEKLDWILKIQPVVPQLEESKTLRAWP